MPRQHYHRLNEKDEEEKTFGSVGKSSKSKLKFNFAFAAGYLALYSDKKDLAMEFLKEREAVAFTLTVEAIDDYWNGNIEDAYAKLSKVCADDDHIIDWASSSLFSAC